MTCLHERLFQNSSCIGHVHPLEQNRVQRLMMSEAHKHVRHNRQRYVRPTWLKLMHKNLSEPTCVSHSTSSGPGAMTAGDVSFPCGIFPPS